MLVYLLIHEQDTDAACGSDAQSVSKVAWYRPLTLTPM